MKTFSHDMNGLLVVPLFIGDE